MDWGTFMRNGYQPKTKQEEDFQQSAIKNK